MTKHLGILILALTALAVVGCKSTPRNNTDSNPPSVGGRNSDSAYAIAQPDDSAGSPSTLNVGDDSPSQLVGLPPEIAGRTVIYFPFDSDELDSDSRALIAAHARFLATRMRLRVQLEGHTDSRGTREYNIGLGERRAQAVRRALGLQGIADFRLSTVSYGEERPAQGGDSENAYAKNRRVELIYSEG